MNTRSAPPKHGYRGIKLNYFEWTVSERGHDWERAHPIGGENDSWFLTDRASMGMPKLMYRYAPNEGVFREFANLELNRPAVKDFADRHGLLTPGEAIVLGSVVGQGESFEFWKASILAMKELVGVWLMLIGEQSSEGLRKIIQWKDDDGVLYRLSLKSGVIATRKINVNLFEELAKGDKITGPAWQLLQQELNEHLQTVSARMLWNGNPRRLTLFQVPQDLLSAMWLQFARAVDGGRSYAKCEGCTNWFEVASPDGGRRDKAYCGNACRARHWRARKEASK